MLPRFTTKSVPNCCGTDTDGSSDGRRSQSDLLHRPRLSDLFLRENGIPMLLPQRRVIITFSPHHIVHIVLVGAAIKMLRIAAGSIVAVVKNLFAFWDGPVRKFKSDSVRGGMTLPDLIFSVSAFLHLTVPLPTFVRLSDGNMAPEPNFKRRLFGPFSNRTFHAAFDITFVGTHGDIYPTFSP